MILIYEDLIVNLFVKVDDFCKKAIPLWNDYLMSCNDVKDDNIKDNNDNSSNGNNNANGNANGNNIKKRKIYRSRKDTLSESEIITILILYQLSQHKNLKKFYGGHMNKILIRYFPKLPSYNRFLMLERKVFFLTLLFTQYLLGKETGIYYIDSTPLMVCKNQRIYKHKTFKHLAERGKTSMGWFYGFKLHVIINNRGELMNFKLIKGNVFDKLFSPSQL